MVIEGAAVYRWLDPAMINPHIFRDYDYRASRQGELDFSPKRAFFLALTWVSLARERQQELGLANENVVIARDCRKADPEVFEAIIKAVEYSGLQAVYVGTEPNCAATYGWATRLYQPLMGIFMTASHIKAENAMGAKVSILADSGELESLTTREIKEVSRRRLDRLLRDPGRLGYLHGGYKPRMTGNVDDSYVKMATVAGLVAAGCFRDGVEQKPTLADLAVSLEEAENVLDVLDYYLTLLDTEAKPLAGIKIAIEASHTPSGRLAAAVYQSLGAWVILLNGDIRELTGNHKADPGIVKNLDGLMNCMEKEEVDFGLAFDLDGDRGAIVIPTIARNNVTLRNFAVLSSDNLMTSLLSFFANQGYQGEVAVVKDVMATKGVDVKARELGYRLEQTDTGYVFVKRKVRELKAAGYAVPISGERSGHIWTQVTGSFEDPLVVSLFFALQGAAYEQEHRIITHYWQQMYRENTVAYKQSFRLEPSFARPLLKELAASPENKTGWVCDASKPPPPVIALGQHKMIQRLRLDFPVGRKIATPAGELRVSEFNSEFDSQARIYRFADIHFTLNGSDAGSFVFRASSTRPVWSCTFETPLWEGENYRSESAQLRYDSVGGCLLDYLERNDIARISGPGFNYSNKAIAEGVIARYRKGKGINPTIFPQELIDLYRGMRVNKCVYTVKEAAREYELKDEEAEELLDWLADLEREQEVDNKFKGIEKVTIAGETVYRWLRPELINKDIFRDYDYRSLTRGSIDFSPKRLFFLTLAWISLAQDKSRHLLTNNNKVVIARDCRRISPVLAEAVIRAVEYSGLQAVYVADKQYNCAASYAWAVRKHAPLMGIFLTASHVQGDDVMGVKVAIRGAAGELESLTVMEIRENSYKRLISILEDDNRWGLLQEEPWPRRVDDVELTYRQMAKIIVLVAAGAFRENIEEIPTLCDLDDDLESAGENVLEVMDTYKVMLDEEAEPLKGLRVVIEGSHTPSGRLAAAVYEALGAEVILLHGEVRELSGKHKADPSIMENLIDLMDSLEESQAHFGLAFDLAGSRGAIVVPVPEKDAFTGRKCKLLPLDSLVQGPRAFAEDPIVISLLFVLAGKGYLKDNPQARYRGRLSLEAGLDMEEVIIGVKGTLESAYSGPADFADTVSGFCGTKLPGQQKTKAAAAEIVAEAARRWDEERGGAFGLEDVMESEEAAELVATVFGKQVREADIPVIKEFFGRHYEYVNSSDPDVEVFVEGTGIGGQRNVSGMLSRLLKPFRKISVLLYSSFGAPFNQRANEILEKLEAKHREMSGDGEGRIAARLDLLKQRKEKVKLFLRAASKSGTTPETMFGFQQQLKKAIRLYSQFVYGREDGKLRALNMIRKLYGKNNVLVGGEPIDRLTDDERMMLAIVFDRLILATGTFVEDEQVSGGEGLARIGGSKFDYFAAKVKEKLKKEFKALGIEQISKVTLYNRFGRRTQVLGPDAWINIFGAYGQGEPEVIENVIAAARVVAERNAQQGEQSLWGKQVAAFARAQEIESVYFGLPTALEQSLADGLQQLIGESIDIGALVGIPCGIKAIAKTTRKLANTSEFKQKDDGKRLYILVEDDHLDQDTRAAQEKIIARETKKGNHVIRVKIKDHSPEEVVRFYYEMMGFVEWYGNYLLADVLANLDKFPDVAEFMIKKYQVVPDEIKSIDFASDEIAAVLGALFSKEIEKGKKDKKPEWMSEELYAALTHLVKDLNPWYQPGVEEGKAAGKVVAETLFSKKKRMEKDPTQGGEEVEVPVRDNELRKAFHAEQKARLVDNNGSYIAVGEAYRYSKGVDFSGEKIDQTRTTDISIETDKLLNGQVARLIKQIDTLRKQQKELVGERRAAFDALEKQIAEKTNELITLAAKADCNEEAARQLALSAFDAHRDGLSVNLSLYAGRQRLEPFGAFVNSLAFVDLLQHATDKQHTDADGDIAGTKRSFQILTHVRERHDERMHFDGMVPAYADGLTDQDMIWCYHQGYKKVYQDRDIDFTDLRLEGTSPADVAKMYILFAKANRIYLELNQASPGGRPIDTSL